MVPDDTLSISEARQIDEICNRFEEAWHSGERPQIEQYLETAPSLGRSSLLRELLRVECECRAKAGDSPALPDYRARFPGDEQLIDSVFLSAEQIIHSDQGSGSSVCSGATLGDYELLAEIGEGGMGVVYKAQHQRLHRIVALKLLKSERVGDSASHARFMKELVAVGKLPIHPNVVHATDAREVDGKHFLVMELVDGVDASRVLRHLGRLAIGDACEIVRQAAAGLCHVHKHRLIHRDVKPSNLIITQEGVVKILDLGLARLPPRDPSAPMTISPQIMGTPDYIAPEQVQLDPNMDIRVDLYSLGCTLYHLLAGQPPYGSPDFTSSTSKLTAHIQERFPSIRKTRPDVPAKLARLVEKLTEKAPEKRFRSPSDLVDAISPFCPGADLVQLLERYECRGDVDTGLWETVGQPSPTLPLRSPGRCWKLIALIFVSVGIVIAGLVGWLAYTGKFT